MLKRNLDFIAGIRHLLSISWFILLGVLPCRMLAGQDAQMKFPDAAAPFTKEKYSADGYIDKTGKARNGGLGCSAYVSVVMHRMRDGNDWLKNYSLSVHQWYGDQIAKHFGLKLTAKLPAAKLLDVAATNELIEAGTIKAGALYVFNVRNGKQGHVGFVRVRSAKRLIQSHYSGMTQYNGLAAGGFRTWLGKTQYRTSDVELYHIVE